MNFNFGGSSTAPNPFGVSNAQNTSTTNPAQPNPLGNTANANAGSGTAAGGGFGSGGFGSGSFGGFKFGLGGGTGSSAGSSANPSATTPAQGFGGFGGPPAAPSSSAPNLFAGFGKPNAASPSSFSLPKPGDQSKGGQSNFFAMPPAGTTTPSSAPSFSLPPKPTEAAAAATPAPAPASVMGANAGTPSTTVSTTPGLLGFGKPAGAAAPPPATTGLSLPTAPTGSLFGFKPAEKKDGAAPAAPAAASTTNLFAPGLTGEKKDGGPAPSSFSFPKPGEAPKPASTAPSMFSIPKPAEKEADKAGSASLFSPPKPGEKEGEKAATPSLFGPAKPAEKEKEGDKSGSLSLFSLSKPGDKPSDKVGTAAAAFSLPKAVEKESDQTAVVQASATSATSGPTVSVPAPSTLQGKTMEEIVNRWTSDLEAHVREFSRFAGEVAVWDRALMENGNNLAAIYSHVTAAEREQSDIDQALDHIERQQKELVSTLDAYEKVTQEILGTQAGSLRSMDTGPADTERDKNYMLATDLHTHLDDLSDSLSQMIESVNGLSLQSSTNESGDDPLTQIAQILNSHLESLQWIDGAVREVEGKVTDVEKRIKESGHTTSLGNASGKSRAFGINR